jgi:hypothetical protein
MSLTSGVACTVATTGAVGLGCEGATVACGGVVGLATGGITAQILVDALKDYESEAQRLADATEKTFGQNLVNARTNITEFVGGATMLNEVIGAIGGGIESFSEDLGVFVDSAQVAATVVGLALVPSMYKYVASLVAATALGNLSPNQPMVAHRL